MIALDPWTPTDSTIPSDENNGWVTVAGIPPFGCFFDPVAIGRRREHKEFVRGNDEDTRRKRWRQTLRSWIEVPRSSRQRRERKKRNR